MLDPSLDSTNTHPLERVIRFVVYAWVFLLVMSLYPYTSDPAGPIKHLITDIAAVVLALLSLLRAWRGGATFRWRSPLSLAAGIFLGIHLLAALLSNYPLAALMELRLWLAPALVAFLAAQVFTDLRGVWQLCFCIMIALALASTYGLLQYLGLDPFPWAARNIEEYRRLPSTFANPNFAGHALVIGIVLGIGWLANSIANKKPISTLLGAVLLALMALHLHLTDMRGGVVALAAAALFALIIAVCIRRGNSPVRSLIAAVVILGCAGGLVVSVAAWKFTTSNATLDSSSALRIHGYHGAAQMILDRPAFGFGPGNYPRFNASYWTPFEQEWYSYTGKKNFETHNELLQAGVDAGIPGIAAYTLLFVAALVAAVHLSCRGTGFRSLGLVLAAAIFAVAVDGQFSFNLHVPVSAALFFLLLGVLHTFTARQSSRVFVAPLTLIAILNLAAGINSFISENAFQRGASALDFAASSAATREADLGAYERAQFALDEAVFELERAARLAPWEPRIYESLGVAFLRRGDHARARDYLRELIRLYPAQPRALAMLAEATLAAEAENEAAQSARAITLANAREHAEDALALAPKLGRAHAVLGAIHAEQAMLDADAQREHWETAQRNFLNSLRHSDENRAVVLVQLAKVQHALGNKDAAISALQDAAHLQPDSPELWRVLDALADLSNDSDRADYMDTLAAAWAELSATEASPNTAAAVVMRLARAYESDGLPEMAARFAREAIDQWPQQPQLWGLYAALLPEDTRLDALHSLAESLRDKSPPAVNPLRDSNPAVALAGLGELMLIAERYEPAAASLEQALPQIPFQLRALTLERYSVALSHLGKHDEALVAARQAVEAAPRNTSARINLVERLLDSGSISEARSVYETLLPDLRMGASDPSVASVRACVEAAGRNEGATP